MAENKQKIEYMENNSEYSSQNQFIDPKNDISKFQKNSQSLFDYNQNENFSNDQDYSNAQRDQTRSAGQSSKRNKRSQQKSPDKRLLQHNSNSFVTKLENQDDKFLTQQENNIIDPKKVENLKLLLNECNTLDFFETKLIELKNIKDFDQEIIQNLTQKVHSGRELQKQATSIQENLLTHDLTAQDIDKIGQTIQQSKNLKVEFEEIKNLETIKLIPQWLKKLYGLIISKSKNMESKSINELTQDLLVNTDNLDAVSLNERLKNQIKEQLQPSKSPKVRDKNLNMLFIKLKLIVWIKETFALLSHDTYKLEQIEVLLQQQHEFNDKDIQKFKQLKYKFNSFFEHLNDIYCMQEQWMNDAKVVQQKGMEIQIVKQKTKEQLEHLQKGVVEILDARGDKIEKVEEVRIMVNSLTDSLDWISWEIEAIELNFAEKKTIAELSLMYKKAIDKKVSQNSQIFQEFLDLYYISQNIQLVYQSLVGEIQKLQQKKYDDTQPVYILFKQNQSKRKHSEIQDLLVQLEQLHQKLDLTAQINTVKQQLENSENFIQRAQNFIRIYQPVLLEDKFSLTEDQMMKINDELIEINEQLYNIPFYLEQQEDDLFRFEWLYAAQCILNLNTSKFIISHLKSSKAKYEGWCQVIEGSQLIKSPNPYEEKIMQKLQSEIQLYQKLEAAIKEIKHIKIMKPEQRADKKLKIRTYDEVNELNQGLQNCQIDVSEWKILISQILHNASEYINTFKNAFFDEKKSLEFYQNLLKDMKDNVPFQLPEEIEVNQILSDAAALVQLIKQNKPVLEILELYKISKVYNPDAEKIQKEFQNKENRLKKIEDKVFSDKELAYPEIIGLQTEFDGLKHLFEGETSQKIENELFVKKILFLKNAWENHEEAHDATFIDIYRLYQDAEQRFKNLEQAKFKEALNFVKNVVSLCVMQLKDIKKITDPQTLKQLIKNPSKSHCGFVDLRPDIQKYRKQLIEQSKKGQESEEEKFSDNKKSAKRLQKKSRAVERLQQLESKYQQDKTRSVSASPSLESPYQKQLEQKQKKQLILTKYSKNIKKSSPKKNIFSPPKPQKKEQKTIKQFTIQLTKVIAGNKSFKLNLDGAIERSRKISKKIESLYGTNEKKLITIGKKLMSLLQSLEDYQDISKKVKKEGFQFKYLMELADMNDQQLEQEDIKLGVSSYLNGDPQDFLGVTIKKKVKPGQKDKEKEKSREKMHKRLEHSTESDKVKSKSKSMPKDKEKESKISLFTRPTPLSNQLNQNNKRNFPSLDGTYLQQAQQQTQNYPSLLQQQQQYMGKHNNFQAVFSDDEENGEEIIPMTEQEVNQYQQILKQEQQQMLHQQNIAFLYNPEERTSHNNNRNNYYQNQDQMQFQSNPQELPEQFLLFQGNLESKNQLFSQIFMVSCEKVQKLQCFPKNRGSTMHLVGSTTLDRMENYFWEIQSINADKSKELMYLGGLVTSYNQNQLAQLNEYALFLRERNKIGIVDWVEGTKLYLMHKNQVPNIFKKEADFTIPSNFGKSLLQFFVICKTYKCQDMPKIEVEQIDVQNMNQRYNYQAKKHQEPLKPQSLNLLAQPQQFQETINKFGQFTQRNHHMVEQEQNPRPSGYQGKNFDPNYHYNKHRQNRTPSYEPYYQQSNPLQTPHQENFMQPHMRQQKIHPFQQNLGNQTPNLLEPPPLGIGTRTPSNQFFAQNKQFQLNNERMRNNFYTKEEQPPINLLKDPKLKENQQKIGNKFTPQHFLKRQRDFDEQQLLPQPQKKLQMNLSNLNSQLRNFNNDSLEDEDSISNGAQNEMDDISEINQSSNYFTKQQSNPKPFY